MPDRGGELLGRFGISRDAEAVWLALIDSGESSIAELAEHTGSRLDTVSAAVECLVAEGLINRDSVSGKLRALEPSLAIQTQIARAERRAFEHLEDIYDVRPRLPDLSKRHAMSQTASSRAMSFEVVLHQPDIQQQLYLLAEQTREIVRSMHRQPSSVDAMRNGNKSVARAASRGIEQRTLVSSAYLPDDARFEETRNSQDLGDSHRILADLPTHMIIYDDDLVVLPLVPENVHLGAMFIRERGVIEPMIALFDNLWSVAQPIFTDKAEGRLSERESRVLELISAGATDDRIARALGVTVRTVRREVATLREALGVGSRMEIVPAAVRRGWL